MKPRSYSDDQIYIKCVVVGDLKARKNELLHNLKSEPVSLENYIPWVIENFCKKIKINNKDVSLTLWDTSGQEDYNQMRKLSYLGADIIFILFNLYDKFSFDNAINKWYTEITSDNPAAKIIFIGNNDKENETDKLAVADAEIQLSKKGLFYLECQNYSPDIITKVVTDSISLFLEKMESQEANKNLKQHIKKCNIF